MWFGLSRLTDLTLGYPRRVDATFRRNLLPVRLRNSVLGLGDCGPRGQMSHSGAGEPAWGMAGRRSLNSIEERMLLSVEYVSYRKFLAHFNTVYTFKRIGDSRRCPSL